MAKTELCAKINGSIKNFVQYKGQSLKIKTVNKEKPQEHRYV